MLKNIILQKSKKETKCLTHFKGGFHRNLTKAYSSIIPRKENAKVENNEEYDDKKLEIEPYKKVLK